MNAFRAMMPLKFYADSKFDLFRLKPKQPQNDLTLSLGETMFVIIMQITHQSDPLMDRLSMLSP